VAEANAQAIEKIGHAIRGEGGSEAVNLKVAEEYVAAFGNLAKQGNTLIVPGNLGEMSSMIASALQIVKGRRRRRPSECRMGPIGSRSAEKTEAHASVFVYGLSCAAIIPSRRPS
jgi:hypothetical protein